MPRPNRSYDRAPVLVRTEGQRLLMVQSGSLAALARRAGVRSSVSMYNWRNGLKLPNEYARARLRARLAQNGEIGRAPLRHYPAPSVLGSWPGAGVVVVGAHQPGRPLDVAHGRPRRRPDPPGQRIGRTDERFDVPARLRDLVS